jgi:ABC-2 type transport system ATP-binding protein
LVIETEGLTRRFGEFTAVSRLALAVPDGKILALLGPNGAGKTTTVRMLAGLLAPTAGRAMVAGYDVRTDPSAVRARVGLVTDVPGLHEQMTLPAYLDFFARIYGMERTDRVRRIDELLAFFDLDGHRAERMVGFSKGMKQKVALARALLHEPTALFLDEPTSGLDPLAARAVRELIIALKQANRSIILCTHDLDEAERLADQVAIMRQGRIVARDAPAALRASASPETTVWVDLASPCAAALPALASVAGVLMPTCVPEGPTPGTVRLEYRTPQPSGVNPRVIAKLVAVGAEVVSVTCITRTLEEVYADAMSGEYLTGEAQAVEATTVTMAGGGR